MTTRGTKKALALAPVPAAADVPVTSAMLGKVRTEVLQRIDQAREEARADNQRLDGKIDAVKADLAADIHRLDGKIDGVKAELKADIHEVKATMHGMQATMHGMQAQMARMEVLFEAQDARNKVVLDGLAAVLSRLTQNDERMARMEDTLQMLATSRSPG